MAITGFGANYPVGVGSRLDVAANRRQTAKTDIERLWASRGAATVAVYSGYGATSLGGGDPSASTTGYFVWTAFDDWRAIDYGIDFGWTQPSSPGSFVGHTMQGNPP